MPTVISIIASALIRILRITMRIRYAGAEKMDALVNAGTPFIMAFWHGRLLMMPYGYRGKPERIFTLISSHSDGEIIAKTIARFGLPSIRGSTTRGGAMALREVSRKIKEGFDVAFTPDGPKGPRHKVQPGVIQAAQMTGAPIVPVSFSSSKKKLFSSWDGFLLPIPFSRGLFVYGDPIYVPSDADDNVMEEKRFALEKSLNELTEYADGRI